MKHSQINEYFLYECLCSLESISSDYTEGKQLCPEIRRTAEAISGQLYTVAVIGEFKRGKSSLINALLGSNILPTDILPATATVTRVVYSTQTKIEVVFVDGHRQEQSIDQLERFATKLSSNGREIARSIREVVVSVPSVLCKNHIQILDTPGLNDSESMTEITMGVLHDVDAALMVISAHEPFSMTEQELVLELIAQSGIRHIVFVASYLDTFQTEAEKDHMISFIRRRIQMDLMRRAEERFGENDALLKKACAILSEPDLFGVSSTQALKGFITDDADLLDESRFPQFKEALFAILTAAQTDSLPAKAFEMTEKVIQALPFWKDAEERSIHEERQRLAVLRRYKEDSRQHLFAYFGSMDQELKRAQFCPNAGLDSSQLETALSRFFIKALSALTTADNTTEAISTAVLNAAEEAEAMLRHTGETIHTTVVFQMRAVEEKFTKLREAAGLPPDAKPADQAAVPFPSFQLNREALLPVGDLAGLNVMPIIRRELNAAIKRYNVAVLSFIGSWRVGLMRQNNNDLAALSPSELDRQESELNMHAAAISYNYFKHLQQALDIREHLHTK